MILFIRKIPANTRLNELADFVQPALKGGLFKKPGRIVKIEILTLRDIHLHSFEYHGLVTVDSDETGHRVIKKLKGKLFKGKHTLVREYVQRRWQNDRRLKHHPEDAVALEKRKTDRRRNEKQLERVVDISDKLTSNGDFVRKI